MMGLRNIMTETSLKMSNGVNEEKIKKLFSALGGSAFGGHNRDVLKWVIIGLAGFVVLILVFGAGMKVGALKARYSYSWAENYQRNFAGSRSGFLENFRRGFENRDFINAHGTFGSIIKIDPSTSSGQATLIIKGKDDVEKIVLVSEKTAITARRESLKVGDLKVDDQVVIIGTPNEQGQIEANLIRLFR